MTTTTIFQFDFRPAFQLATAFRRQFSATSFRRPPTSFNSRSALPLRITARSLSAIGSKIRTNSRGDAYKVSNKPSICTADELHYVSVNGSDWRLALWRYLPSLQVHYYDPP